MMTGHDWVSPYSRRSCEKSRAGINEQTAGTIILASSCFNIGFWRWHRAPQATLMALVSHVDKAPNAARAGKKRRNARCAGYRIRQKDGKGAHKRNEKRKRHVRQNITPSLTYCSRMNDTGLGTISLQRGFPNQPIFCEEITNLRIV